MITLIFGPPGSGKGTQAAVLVRSRGWIHVSTGDLLRSEVADGSELGREVAPIMADGKFISDDLMMRVIERRLTQTDTDAGVLFDGFPRTVQQAEAFDAVISRAGRTIDHVLCLEVPEAVLMQRVLHRGELEGRADDTAEKFLIRMEEYREKTVPTIDHYRPLAGFAAVDGDRAVEDVAVDVARLFGNRANSVPS